MALSLCILLPVSARGDDDDYIIASEAVARGEILPLDSILDRVAAVQAGQILEIALEADDGRWLYEVELIDAHGRIMELELDARTGAVLSLERDD